ncbi:conserved hypothetical protein [Mycobacterium marinum E11]|nr:conserved hypothetical protein [Mycobacterium marinum E11]
MTDEQRRQAQPESMRSAVSGGTWALTSSATRRWSRSGFLPPAGTSGRYGPRWAGGSASSFTASAYSWACDR